VKTLGANIRATRPVSLTRAAPAAALILLCTFPLAHAQPQSQADEYAIKATYLYNFAKFVQWPQAPVSAVFTIGLIGDDPFGTALDLTVKNKQARGRSLVVKRFATIEALEPCQILFVARSERRRLDEILKATSGTSVLTVGDGEEFAQKGAVIGFKLRDNRVSFVVNLAAANSAGLKISSELLGVADTVLANPRSNK
jgi:hypothetical protein